jgi:hypothetical protein
MSAASPGAGRLLDDRLAPPLFGRAVVHEAAPGLSRSKPTAAILGIERRQPCYRKSCAATGKKKMLQFKELSHCESRQQIAHL